MVSHALDEWEVDRKAEIRLARELAVKSPAELPAQSASNILLASYIRVCVAEFQAFCAALYGEAVESVRTVLDRAVSPALRDQLVNQLHTQTALARGNPTHDNLRRDFDRLGPDLRKRRLVAVGPATDADLAVLDDHLMKVRNDLVHGGERFPSVESADGESHLVTIADVDDWLRALDRIARTMDSVVGENLSRPLGRRPW